LAPNIEKSNLNIIVPGFGCCRGEILATRGPLYDIQRFGINFVNNPEDADILLITGFSSEECIKKARDMQTLAFLYK
jgi:Ni,Fe-hydrogenase III small subunit